MTASGNSSSRVIHFGSVAQKEQQRDFMVWFQRSLQSKPEQISCQLPGSHRPGNQLTAVRSKTRGYDVAYRVACDDGYQAVVNFAALGQLLYRTEKFENEAIVLLYLRRHANTSVPQPLGIGKFSLPPHIGEGFAERDLASDALVASKTELQNLNLNISEWNLNFLCCKTTDIVLGMSKPEFTRIGSPVQAGNRYTTGRLPLASI
ncbi:hypothetical protein ABEW05_003093 [Botrytis cinerea]